MKYFLLRPKITEKQQKKANNPMKNRAKTTINEHLSEIFQPFGAQENEGIRLKITWLNSLNISMLGYKEFMAWDGEAKTL